MTKIKHAAAPSATSLAEAAEAGQVEACPKCNVHPHSPMAKLTTCCREDCPALAATPASPQVSELETFKADIRAINKLNADFAASPQAPLDFDDWYKTHGQYHTVSGSSLKKKFAREAYEAGRASPQAPAPQAVVGEASEDTKRLDWLDTASNDMLLEFGFEMDGGVYLRIDAPGHGGTDIRERNSARQLIDSAMVVAPC